MDGSGALVARLRRPSHMEDGQKCDKQRSVRRKQLIVGAHRKEDHAWRRESEEGLSRLP